MNQSTALLKINPHRPLHGGAEQVGGLGRRWSISSTRTYSVQPLAFSTASSIIPRLISAAFQGFRDNYASGHSRQAIR